MKIHVPSMLAIGVDKHTQQTNKQPQCTIMLNNYVLERIMLAVI